MGDRPLTLRASEIAKLRFPDEGINMKTHATTYGTFLRWFIAAYVVYDRMCDLGHDGKKLRKARDLAGRALEAFYAIGLPITEPNVHYRERPSCEEPGYIEGGSYDHSDENQGITEANKRERRHLGVME